MSAAVMGNWICKHFIFKSLHFVSNRPHQRRSEAVSVRSHSAGGSDQHSNGFSIITPSVVEIKMNDLS